MCVGGCVSVCVCVQYFLKTNKALHITTNHHTQHTVHPFPRHPTPHCRYALPLPTNTKKSYPIHIHTSSRPTLQPTQPPVFGYRFPLQRVKRSGRCVYHPLLLVPRFKKEYSPSLLPSWLSRLFYVKLLFNRYLHIYIYIYIYIRFMFHKLTARKLLTQ